MKHLPLAVLVCLLSTAVIGVIGYVSGGFVYLAYLSWDYPGSVTFQDGWFYVVYPIPSSGSVPFNENPDFFGAVGAVVGAVGGVLLGWWIARRLHSRQADGVV